MTNEAGANRNPSFGLGDVMQEIRGMGHLYGLNSKSEKDFECKIKQFVNRREIDI